MDKYGNSMIISTAVDKLSFLSMYKAYFSDIKEESTIIHDDKKLNSVPDDKLKSKSIHNRY